MKKTVKRTLSIIIGITLIIAAIMLVRHRRSELANQALPSIRPIPIHTKTAAAGKLPIIEHYLGTIEPVTETVISAQTTGYIMSIDKDVGDYLVAGETIAEIDNRLPGSQKKTLKAKLSGARVDISVKKKILDRRKKLYKEKAVDRESLDQANLAHKLALSRFEQLQHELEAATVTLSFSSIQPLFDGIITERMKDPGDIVMPGTPIFKIEDTSQGYKVLVRVPQETITQLSGKTPLKLIAKDNTINTTIYHIYPAITEGHLATVEIRVPERPFGLPSYSTVGVDLVVREPEGIIVSSECILEQETGAFVFIVQDNQTVLKVSVKILGRTAGRVIVEGSLSSGTSLAAGPESKLLQLSDNKQIVPVGRGKK